MATCKDCKDCFHYKLCGVFGYISPVECCGFYTDRSRFVELPCKAGDYLYQPHRNQISKYAVKCLEVGYANIVFVNWEIIEGVAYPLHGIYKDEIGKTVFLTREEAEQALKEREGNG